jgi:hypothetical protein
MVSTILVIPWELVAYCVVDLHACQAERIEVRISKVVFYLVLHIHYWTVVCQRKPSHCLTYTVTLIYPPP